MNALPLAVLVLEGDAAATAVNAAWRALTGLDDEGSSGPGWLAAIAPADREQLQAALARAAEWGESGCADVRLDAPLPARWTRWWWQPDEDGRVHVCIADIDADKDREADLWQRATHDPLTGLTNRSEFLSLVERALRRAERTSDSVAVMFVDLDGFKTVNDNGGHAVGDEVLCAVARRIEGAIRPTDVAARVGGDEFAVLCEDLDPAAEADAVVDRLRAAVSDPISSTDGVTRLTAAAGVAFAEPTGDTAVDLLARADLAMYAAKRGADGSGGEGGGAVLGSSPVVPAASPVRSSRAALRAVPDLLPASLGAAASPSSDELELLVESVVRRVYGVGMALQSAASVAEGLAEERLRAALDELEWLVHDLQLDVLALRRRDEAAEPDGVEVAMRSLLEVERLLGLLWASSAAAGSDAARNRRLMQATKLTHGALLALDPQSVQ